jgi:hypothetical protein
MDLSLERMTRHLRQFGSSVGRQEKPRPQEPIGTTRTSLQEPFVVSNTMCLDKPNTVGKKRVAAPVERRSVAGVNQQPTTSKAPQKLGELILPESALDGAGASICRPMRIATPHGSVVA